MRVHLNLTQTDERRVVWHVCPDCGRRAPFAAFYQDWYGIDKTCMNCGRTWRDGEWMPLPFCRGSRELSKQAARRRWKCGVRSKTK